MPYLLKRPFDAVAAASALLLLAPLLLGTAALAALGGLRPVLFRQQRTGWRERAFCIFKFRTMTDARDAAGHPLPDAQRLTPLGRWLRRTSLDELPQLLNVLRGEMSLVGPRPLLPRYLPRYSTAQRQRHRLRPGLTGWAQVQGRNALSWEEKFALDVWYVHHVSFWLDLRILARTVGRVWRGSGVSAEGAATMEEFWGNGSL